MPRLLTSTLGRASPVYFPLNRPVLRPSPSLLFVLPFLILSGSLLSRYSVWLLDEYARRYGISPLYRKIIFLNVLAFEGFQSSLNKIWLTRQTLKVPPLIHFAPPHRYSLSLSLFRFLLLVLTSVCDVQEILDLFAAGEKMNLVERHVFTTLVDKLHLEVKSRLSKARPR